MFQYMLTNYVLAPVSSILTKKFGPQAVCFTGGLLSGMAFLLSAFASNLYTLYITFGVFPGGIFTSDH